MASADVEKDKDDRCSSCNRHTKYKCIDCSLPICNRCTVFEKDEDVEGWQEMKSVGYCKECSLTNSILNIKPRSSYVKKQRLSSETSTDSEDINSTNSSKESCSKFVTSELLSTSSDYDEEVEQEILTKKKKAGRKATWSNSTLDDFIDIIVNNANYQRKLIFMNTKNQQNGMLYEEILKELKKRCSSRKETLDFSVTQLRNKFKKCVAECKHVSMTVKTATGIKRFQEDKGYTAWFDKLFPLVQSRDSCKPQMAVEPSSNSTTTDPFGDLEEESESEEGTSSGVKQFVPTKKKKVTPKEQIGEAVELFKSVLQQDTTKDILNYMRDEAERARQHELEITKLILNSTNPATTTERDHNQPHHWQHGYSQFPSVDHIQHSFQHHQLLQQNFPTTIPTHPMMNQDDGIQFVNEGGSIHTMKSDVTKRYHSM